MILGCTYVILFNCVNCIVNSIGSAVRLCIAGRRALMFLFFYTCSIAGEKAHKCHTGERGNHLLWSKE